MATRRTKTGTAIAAVDPLETAKAQAEEDAKLMAALQAKAAEAPAAPEAPRETIEDAYASVTAMIAEQKRKTRLSEQSLVKLWELQLMWVLNERQRQAYSMPQQAMPVPDEIISGEE